MPKKLPPSQTAERFIIRLPDGMRDRIARAAKRSGRSMNAEIIRNLESNYPAPPEIDDLIREVKGLLPLLSRRDNKPVMVEAHNLLVEMRDRLELLNFFEDPDETDEQ